MPIYFGQWRRCVDCDSIPPSDRLELITTDPTWTNLGLFRPKHADDHNVLDLRRHPHISHLGEYA